MYHEYYQLKTDPFRLSPDHHFCLRHTIFTKAKAYMQFAVERAEGFVMITGRPGTGKTTLIEDVLASLGDQEFLSAELVSAQLEGDDLLRMTAFNFGILADGKTKSQLLLEMQGFFSDRIADGQRPLLVVDEAQGLSLNALEELRLLTNMRIDGRPMLQIFLVGQEDLRDLVQDPRMEQLHQRMIATCHLEPLDLKQTAAYVMHRLKVAGWNGKPELRARIFPPLYRFSHGIPRRINLFMGRLLLHGWLEEKTELSEREAQLVFEELRQEHLAPPESENELPLSELEAIDSELLRTPDQNIGAMLMEQERKDVRREASEAKDAGAAATEPVDGAPRSGQSESNVTPFGQQPAAEPRMQVPAAGYAEPRTEPGVANPASMEAPAVEEGRKGPFQRFFRWFAGRKP